MATKLPVCPDCGERCVFVLHGKMYCGKCRRRLHPRRLYHIDGYGWTR